MKRTRRQISLPRFLRVQFALVMREMATSYGKSSFGYLWAILEPIGAITVLSIAFSLIFGSPSLGESFPLFYATGYIPFSIYSSMQQGINGALRENKKLLFYPRVTYMDAIISRFALTFTTQLLVGIIIFGTIMIVYQVSPNIDIIPIFIAIVAASVLGLGVGCLNSVIIHLFPGWKHMWGIITRPLFLVSCVFYLFDTLPEWAQIFVWYNPLVHAIGLTRRGFYPSYEANYASFIYPFLIGALTFSIGLLLLRRHADDLLNS